MHPFVRGTLGSGAFAHRPPGGPIDLTADAAVPGRK
jgi:hypothetical protein